MFSTARGFPALLLLLTPVGAQDWYVDGSATGCGTATGGPGDPYCTIGAALAAAADGDTIHVAPGTYAENLVLDRDLALIGTLGDQVTTVDGTRSGSVITIRPGTTVEIAGLTLANGDHKLGAGILVETDATLAITRVTIRDATLRDNQAYIQCAAYPDDDTTWGGGIAALSNSEVHVLDTSIVDNLSETGYCGLDLGNAYGGGVYNAGTMTLERCILNRNIVRVDFQGGGGSIWNAGTLTLRDSVVRNTNLGLGSPGAITSTQALTLRNCTLARNAQGFGSGNPVVSLGTLSTATVDACILWDNGGLGFGGQGGFQQIGGGTASVSYSVLQGGWTGAGSDNLDADPRFVGPANLRLRADSPAIDSGDPTLAPTGLDLAGVPRLLDGNLDRVLTIDRGAHEFTNVKLTVSGDPVPGGSLTLATTRTAGLPVWVLVSTNPGETFVHPLGSLFLDLAAPWQSCFLGPIPNSRTVQVPLDPPLGTTVVFQAVALGPTLAGGRRGGNASNPVTLTIQ